VTWFLLVGIVVNVILTGLALYWVFRNTKPRDDSAKKRKDRD
jgi:hypothetical protein